MTTKKTGGTWLEDLWNSNERMRNFADEEDPGFDFIMKVELLMEEEGINRVQLAERMKRTPAYVSQVLSEGRNLTVRTMVRIAKALNGRLHLDVIPVQPAVRAPEIPEPAVFEVASLPEPSPPERVDLPTSAWTAPAMGAAQAAGHAFVVQPIVLIVTRARGCTTKAQSNKKQRSKAGAWATSPGEMEFVNNA